MYRSDVAPDLVNFDTTGPATIFDLADSAHLPIDGYNIHIIPGIVTDDTETIAIIDDKNKLAIITNIDLDTPDVVEKILRDFAGDDYDNFVADIHNVKIRNVHPGFSAHRSVKSRWAYTLKYIDKTFYTYN